MKNIIPYEKEITFDTKIAEITSISLEYNAKVEGNAIVGEFVVSGDYKAHEVSVNKDNFKYNLPFTVELGENIDLESVKHDISDFTYDIIDNNKLRVKIDFLVEANEKKEEEIIPEINEDDLDEKITELLDDSLRDDNEVKEEIVEEKNNENEIRVMSNINEFTDTFVTYHIHIVKEEETIESICQAEHISKDILMEYNELTNVNVDDKIIIPEIDNE